MRIKKLTAVAMTGMMVLGMGTSVCAASPITRIGGTDTKEVKATYYTDDKADTVYSVEITWGSMEYTYTIGSEGTWDPSTHQYTGKSEGEWTCDDGADQVTVTNHSNAAVNAAFKYEAEGEYNGITGSFNSDTVNLETAEGTTKDKAPNETVKLTLDGALDKNVETHTKIGTATVTLSEAN